MGQSYIVVDILGCRVVRWWPKGRCEGGEGGIAPRWVILRNNGGNWVAIEREVIRPALRLLISMQFWVSLRLLSFSIIL